MRLPRDHGIQDQVSASPLAPLPEESGRALEREGHFPALLLSPCGGRAGGTPGQAAGLGCGATRTRGGSGHGGKAPTERRELRGPEGSRADSCPQPAGPGPLGGRAGPGAAALGLFVSRRRPLGGVGLLEPERVNCQHW